MSQKGNVKGSSTIVAGYAVVVVVILSPLMGGLPISALATTTEGQIHTNTNSMTMRPLLENTTRVSGATLKVDVYPIFIIGTLQGATVRVVVRSCQPAESPDCLHIPDQPIDLQKGNTFNLGAGSNYSADIVLPPQFPIIFSVGTNYSSGCEGVINKDEIKQCDIIVTETPRF